MNQVVISYQDGVGRYVAGQERLHSSIYVHSPWTTHLAFSKTNSPDFTPHYAQPYGFKIDAFNKARELGYTQVLYLDCSVAAVADIQPVFDHINEYGYIMQEAGHFVGRWCNDRALNYFGVNRDDAMSMLMYGNAGFLGLDFDNPLAHDFFVKWEAAMRQGMFKGAWNNDNFTESTDSRCAGHRHDMCTGSIIANQLGMNEHYVKGDKWLHYADPNTPPKEGVYLHAQGL